LCSKISGENWQDAKLIRDFWLIKRIRAITEFIIKSA
jgi:hypothetical protein